MSIQSVRALSTSTYQSFSAYMTVRQQKVATVALLIVGCLVAFFVYYWHCFGPKKRNVQVNNADNNIKNNGADAQVNNFWQNQINKMNKTEQELENQAAQNLAAIDQQIQLQIQQMMNIPIQHDLNNFIVTPKPALVPVPRFVAPAPVPNAAPPQVIAPPPIHVAPPQLVVNLAPRQNFTILPELVDHVDTAISYLSDLEKSMNQRGIATNAIDLASIIANYHTQIKPTLVHPIEGADDAQRLKWKNLLHTFDKVALSLMRSMYGDKFVPNKDENELDLLAKFSKCVSPIYHCLAESYYLASRFEEAVKMADKVVGLNEKDKLFVNIADYYYQQGQLKEAVNILEKINVDKVAKTTGYAKIVEAYCQKGQPEEATEVLEKIYSFEKVIKETGYAQIAEAYRKKNQFEKALKALKEIIYNKAARETGYTEIAWAYYQKNQLKDAFNVLDKIYIDKKVKDDCLMKIADDCYKKSKREEAREAIHKVSLNNANRQTLLKKYE